MECVSKPYPRYAGEGREGERCGRLIQIREGRVSKPYPRYVEGVRGEVWCDQQTLPALCGGGWSVSTNSTRAMRRAWCAWGEVKNNRKGLNALAVVCVLVERLLKTRTARYRI